MERINFSISINAPKEKVWNVLWDETSYSKWTSVFAEGSSVVTDNWKEGSKVLFLDGNGSGMVSMVAANKPNQYMSFKHMGEVKDGIEDISSENIKGWLGSMENYTLKEAGGKTELKVDMDITENFKDFFLNTWPKALEQVKLLSENNQ